MNSNWQKIKLSDVANVVGGGTPSTKNPDYWNGQISWITPKDLSSFKERYIGRGNRSISNDGLKNSSAELLPKDSVLLSSRAPIGYVAIAKNDLTTNQGFKSLVLKDGHNPLFFYYLLKLNKPYIEAQGNGSVFQEISGSVVKSLIFNIPPIEEQKAIADILSSLDTKIEINQQINQTLESIAQALFKSWFIDFDPVKAKMAGRVPKGMDADLLALFPDSFEDSELGPIPKGWEVKKIKDIGVVITGKTPSTKNAKYFGNQYPFIKIPNMNSVWVTDTNTCLSESGHQTQSKKLLPKGAVIVSCIASPGLVAIVSEPSHTNQQINAVIPKNNYPTSWLFCVLINLRTNIIAMASGGSVNLNLNKNDFSHIKVRKPDNAVMKAFDQIAGKLFDKILTNEIENKTLTETRDTLLPKLLSDELRVNDVEA